MKSKRWFATHRKWWLLIGAILVYLLAFDWLERLVRNEPASSEQNPGAAQRIATSSPRRPEVRRLDDGAVEIRHDFFRRTTIRLGDEDSQDTLFNCLEKGFEERFVGRTEDWDGERVRRETRTVRNACLGEAKEGSAPPSESDITPPDIDPR